MIAKFPALASHVDGGDEEEEHKTSCNKDTGATRRLQKWTRGVWFCVGGGGHVTMWQPLYK